MVEAEATALAVEVMDGLLAEGQRFWVCGGNRQVQEHLCERIVTSGDRWGTSEPMVLSGPHIYRPLSCWVDRRACLEMVVQDSRQAAECAERQAIREREAMERAIAEQGGLP